MGLMSPIGHITPITRIYHQPGIAQRSSRSRVSTLSTPWHLQLFTIVCRMIGLSMKKFSLFIWFALSFAPVSGSLHAQWTNIAPNLFPPHKGSVAHYAISFRDRILWLVTENLYMSTDSGKSWSKPCQNIPWSVAPYDIQFFDRQHGLVAGFDGAWLTQDQGVTWSNLTHNYTTDACFGNSPTIIALSPVSGRNAISTDAGTSWQYGGPSRYWSNMVYVKSGSFLSQSDGKIFSTQDFGLTWKPTSGTIHDDSYSFAIDSCDPNLIYYPSENWISRTDNTSQIYRSSDLGNTWTSPLIAAIPFLCGSVSLSPNAAYVQAMSDGIYRSTDRGLTWKNIGGPSNQWDTRLLVAINDNMIIAADADGNIWRTTNSGGELVSGSASMTLLSTANIENDTIGNVVFVPIKSSVVTASSPFDLSLHFDTSMLVYQGTYQPNGATDLTTSRSSGFARLHFDTTMIAPQDSVIGYAEFQIFPKNTPCTQVLFDSVNLTIGKGSTCASMNPSFTATICSKPGCGTPTLSDYLRYHKLPALSIVPNPASGLTSLHSDTDLGEVAISIYDVMGVMRSQMTDELSPAHSAVINTSSLPSGLYSVRVESMGFGISVRLMHVR